MVQSRSSRFAALCAVAGLLAAAPALAQTLSQQQDEVDPGRGADANLGAKPRTATSDIAATKPIASAAEQREAKTLSRAVFSKPGAAAKAAAKVDEANTPDLAPAKAKPEWTDDKGLGFGGKGVEVKAPF